MIKEISIQELSVMDRNEYILVDIRGETAYNHGFIPGAVLMNPDDIQLDKSKKIIVYCMKGLISLEISNKLCKEGYDAYNLKGGFREWLLGQFSEETRYHEIEQSLRGRFKKSIFSRFAKAIKTYDLLREGDKIAVCISGGKDSMLMAKLFQELKRHNKFEFSLVFMVMDPGYSPENRKIIENNGKILNIPLTFFESDIFDAVFNVEKSPCYLCARMRRGHLYAKAKELGCNKIAIGHHYDDVIETILMGMLYGAQIQTMMPKLHSTNFEGMELIRPMYLIREDDIKSWKTYNNLNFIQCACRFTDTCSVEGASGNSNSKRHEVKKLIKSLKETNPFVESNIFNSVENVCLDTVIGYKAKGVKYSFLDEY